MHCLADFEGLPVVTWSAPVSAQNAAPSPAYMTAWVQALRETFQLNDQGMKKILRDIPGMDPDVMREAIKAVPPSVDE